jgi:hypothetical protein
LAALKPIPNRDRCPTVLDDEVDTAYLDDDWLDDTARKARTAEEALRRQGRERATQPVEPADDAAMDQPPAPPGFPDPVPPIVPPIPAHGTLEAPPNHVTWEPNQDG